MTRIPDIRLESNTNISINFEGSMKKQSGMDACESEMHCRSWLRKAANYSINTQLKISEHCFKM